MMANYYLIKSEPKAYSIDDLRRDGRTVWDGVRNYQARNLLRSMRVGDMLLFYHSSCKVTGVAGLARVCQAGYDDPSQFDPNSRYYDRNSSGKGARWTAVDVAWVEQFAKPVTLAAMRGEPHLDGMALLQRGQRLSVQPVSPQHFALIVQMGRQTADKGKR